MYEGLARLGLWVLEGMRDGCSVDGIDVQEKALEFGVIEAVQREGTCDPSGDGLCACDEFDGPDEPRTCYPDTEPTASAREALEKKFPSD